MKSVSTVDAKGIQTTLSFKETPQRYLLPWTVDISWEKSASFASGPDALLAVALTQKGIHGALPAPVAFLKWSPSNVIDVGSTVAPGLGKFAATQDILVADFNADGRPDLFFNNFGAEPPNALKPGERNALLMSTPTPATASEVVGFPWSDTSRGSTVGDFNGDGRLDIFVHNGSTAGTVAKVPSYWLRQSAAGKFERVDVAQAVLDVLGAYTTALDVNRDGKADLVTISNEGELFALLDLSATVRLPASDRIKLDIPSWLVPQVMGLQAHDFDANGRPDIVVFGYGPEVLGTGGVAQGREMRGFIVFDAWSSTQQMINLFPDPAQNFAAKGGIEMQALDADRSGTTDLELRTLASNGVPIRLSVMVGQDRSVKVVRDLGDFSFFKGTLFDVNQDGVADAVYPSFAPDSEGTLMVRFGLVSRSGSDLDDEIRGTSAKESLLGLGGRDTLVGSGGSDTLDGGAGLDHVRYPGAASSHRVSKVTGSDSYTVAYNTGVDEVLNVERLLFNDRKVALDLAPTDRAGQALLLIGAVLGRETMLTKRPLMATVIDLFDQGFSIDQLAGALMRLPIWGGTLTPSDSASDIAKYLLTRVNGRPPTASELRLAVESIEVDVQGTLLTKLALSAANIAQVDLVGLSMTGFDVPLGG